MSEFYNGAPLPIGWMVYNTEDGRPYFHNHLTKTTQWDAPTNSQSSSTSTNAGTRSAPGGTRSAPGGSLRESGDDQLHGYGATDGEITTSADGRGGRGAPKVGMTSSRQLGLPSGARDKKKGYASLPDDLSGSIDLEKQGQQSAAISATSQTVSDPGKWCWFVDVRHLQSFFDTDTKTVANNVLASMLPYKVFQALLKPSSSSFPSSDEFASSDNLSVSSIRTSSDFYGPFWIPTSLIFFMFITSNISGSISGHSETNFLALAIAFSMLYGYLVAIPLIIWALIMFLGGPLERESITIRQLVSVYGYSFALALPIAILSLVPSMICRWLFAAIASGVSFLFVSLNFKRDLLEAEPSFKLGVVVLLIVAQTSFYSAFPLYYFNY